VQFVGKFSIWLCCRLEKGLPNLSQGILYQKLQMLNCCIEKKISRDQNVSTLHESSTDNTTDKPETSAEGEGVISHEIESVECTEAGEAADEDDNEEFFDCEADSIEDNSPAPTASSDGAIALQPQGRLCLLGEQKLMNSDEFIYVPLTQEPSPMTEDMLEEHADMLTRYSHLLHNGMNKFLSLLGIIFMSSIWLYSLQLFAALILEHIIFHVNFANNQHS